MGKVANRPQMWFELGRRAQRAHSLSYPPGTPSAYKVHLSAVHQPNLP